MENMENVEQTHAVSKRTTIVMSEDEEDIGKEKNAIQKVKNSRCVYSLAPEKKFASLTSLHGYGIAANTNNKFRKYFWLSICLTGMGTFIYFAQSYFNEYLNVKPTVTSSNKYYVSELKLPRITICSVQPLVKNKIEEQNNVIFYNYQNRLDEIQRNSWVTFKENGLATLTGCFISNKIEQDEKDYLIKMEVILSTEANGNELLERLTLIVNKTVNERTTEEKEIITLVTTKSEELYGNASNYELHEQIMNKIGGPSFCKDELNNVLDTLYDVPHNDKDVQEFYYYLMNYQSIYGIEKEFISITIAAEMNLRNMTEKVSWNITDNIISCLHASIECDGTNFISVVTELGVCYEFKAIEKQVIPGQTGGLQLLLNMETFKQFDQSAVDANYYGLHVVVHAEGEPAAGYLRYSPVRPGYATNIQLKNKLTQLLDIDDGGNCKGSNKLEIFHIFTTFGCEMNCQLKNIERICNCLAIEDVRIENDDDFIERGCKSLDEMICAYNIRKKIEKVQSCENCKFPACTSSDYSPKITLSVLKNSSFINYIYDSEMKCLEDRSYPTKIPFDYRLWAPNITILETLKDECLSRFNWNENILKLNVFYNELSNVETKQLSKYSVIDFIGTIGGTMGIYTGMSLISIVEIAEYLFYRITTIGEYST
ncbi:hypothetical protein SNEBB_007363 [Seison nebaliae]|nr:hypothetical protein SNEBB_007363 [Seison nebaliae]